MADMTWHAAIQKVLGASPTPLYYKQITERILEEGLRKKVGATPEATVNAQISASIKHDGEDSPYRRVDKGTYVLSDSPPPPPPTEDPDDNEDGVVISFGAFWERDKVNWKAKPRLLGVFQTEGATKANPTQVDFSGQHGVYLLHDIREVIYVGRTTDGDLGKRLLAHTQGRLQGRWSRFSWFGFRPVSTEGKLGDKMQSLPTAYGMENLIFTLEAVLIESLEPRQNRKRGDRVPAVEYRQVQDPEIAKRARKELLERMMRDAT